MLTLPSNMFYTVTLSATLWFEYNDSIVDAVADLGKPEEIVEVFAGFQKYLYQKAV